MPVPPPLRPRAALPGASLLCACLLAACASPPPAAWRAEPLDAAGELALTGGARPHFRTWQERITLLMGGRTYENDAFWAPLDEPSVFGLELESVGLGVIDLEVGMHLARERKDVLGSDHHTSTFELGVGGRKTWTVGPLRPYLGAGVAFYRAELHIDDAAYEELDGGAGYYAHAGAYVLLGEAYSLGLDYRRLGGTDVDLPGFAASDVDYDQLSLTLGVTF